MLVRPTEGNWCWHHKVSECHHHIQLAIEYRKWPLDVVVEGLVLEAISGFRGRYHIDIRNVVLDRNHVHVLCRSLPKYSGGRVIRSIKSVAARYLFKESLFRRKSRGEVSFGPMGIIQAP